MRLEYSIALFVAFLWSLAPMLMIDIVRAHGAALCIAIRVVFSALIFALYGVIFLNFNILSPDIVLAASLSGLVGVLLGDGLLYLGLKMLGPRRNTLVFSTNIIFSIVLGIVFLGEQYAGIVWIGAVLLITGMFLAILYAPSRSGRTKTGSLVGVDDLSGQISLGVMATLFAAFCHAYGLFILTPHLQQGVEPAALNAIRLAVAAFFCLPVLALSVYKGKMPSMVDMLKIAVIGFVAMGLGSFLLQYALRTAELGIINMLSATSPIWVLPLLWWRTRALPHPIAWLGALLGVWGLSFVFLPDMYLSL